VALAVAAAWEATEMPKVGSKHFPYTPKGEKEAKAYAKKTGKKEKRIGTMQGVTEGRTPKRRGKPFKTPDSLVSYTLR
jgi:hypothetical protein